MRILAAVLLVAAACGGKPVKKESPLVNEGSDTPQTCCCKSTPMTSEDAQPVYNMQNRMECSTNKGECVDDVQCNGTQNATQGGHDSSGNPPPPPDLPKSPNG